MEQLGITLRLAREEKGLSLEDLQQLTKIRTRYLKAIEDGDLSALPGTVYARGFIKSYAEHVGLDASSLLEEYGLSAPMQEAQRTRTTDSPRSFRKNTLIPSRTRSYLMQGAVVIAVLVVLAATFEYIIRSHAPKTPVSPSSLSQQSAVSSSNVSSTHISSKGTTANPAKSTKDSTSQNAPNVVDQPTTPLAPTEKKTGNSYYKLPAAVPIDVVIKATNGACWIDVFDGDKELEQVTLKVGDAKHYTSSSNLTIKTGAAPNVTMTIGKQPVVLEQVYGGYQFHFSH